MYALLYNTGANKYYQYIVSIGPDGQPVVQDVQAAQAPSTSKTVAATANTGATAGSTTNTNTNSNNTSTATTTPTASSTNSVIGWRHKLSPSSSSSSGSVPVRHQRSLRNAHTRTKLRQQN